MTVEVSRLFYYPVKSLRRIEVDEALVVETGIDGDREYLVVDEYGELISQREVHALALLDSADVIAACVPSRQRVSIKLHSWHGVGQDQGDAAAELVSRVVGSPARVIGFPSGYERRTGVGNGITKYADGYPITVVSEDSLAQLNEWLDEPVPIERFRPNIVLRGLGAPFVEDDIASLRIGALELDLVKLCGRCVMTTIDQDTSVKGQQPLRELGAHRVLPQLGGGQEIMFAVNAIPRRAGTIRVGDAVEVTMHDRPYVDRIREGANP